MFNKSNLAVAGAVSKSHYSQHVLFQKGGTVATDGSIAVSVTMPDGDITEAPQIFGENPKAEFDDFCVSVDDIKAVKKGVSKKTTGSFPILRNAFVIGEKPNQKLAATDLSSVVAVNTIDRKDSGFPLRFSDLGEVTPTGEPTFVVKFDGKLLERFVSILNEAIAGDIRNPIVFKFWESEEAVVAEAQRIETGQKIKGLIMPMTLKD